MKNLLNEFLSTYLNIATDVDIHISSSPHSQDFERIFYTLQPLILCLQLISQASLWVNHSTEQIRHCHLYPPCLLWPLGRLQHCWPFHPFETHSSLSFCFIGSAFPPTSLITSLSSIMLTPFFSTVKQWDFLRIKYRPSSLPSQPIFPEKSKIIAPINICRPNVYLQLRLFLWALNLYISLPIWYLPLDLSKAPKVAIVQPSLCSFSRVPYLNEWHHSPFSCERWKKPQSLIYPMTPTPRQSIIISQVDCM